MLDESGDPTMNYSDREQPQPPEIFLLCGCLFEYDVYTDFARALKEFKRRHLRSPDIPLVSSQIRRWHGPFAFLKDDDKRLLFHNELAALIQETSFTVFAVGIDKWRHWAHYQRAVSPYDLSLAFIMERVTMCVGPSKGWVKAVAECRGREPDRQLRGEFHRLLTRGTRYVSADRLQGRFLPALECWPKKQNVPGLQLADLVAYPLANRLCHPEGRRKDFDLVREKLYRSRKGIWGAGLKVFPPAAASDHGL
jgi:hypothetical protein